ncbi:MAG: hypothetical protein A3F31_03265 [Candidatus Levybacteria bacterium RIFCSPHIGHO2_12_FULL_38_12]|nr:MAG: hypothetical protein A2770_03690 [Candidatus Levybacteria bacterium RIFCSPHIGHO2_01_FULL_38_12]OGH22120.1 MAG: hypothetical protein A3D75_02635 [Candidatus Levybacteria bacterium RIFCSPHIGHO2_02_FULL_37_18]OGH22968.1 MAG: hypothetical protein A3F31_03265 [Candidatus Levybacteria bacterium RIFCSPHIGHO2_12_FULL_38_12]OGH34138.1 MAG: hypothetical protein A3A47_03395 [Candidatus Levybacteria bacterium RIFCSPLOWO2_01_FULL_37_20]OGH44931.1 MAG: hypothetical protein A3J14_01060 [Candidatus Lev
MGLKENRFPCPTEAELVANPVLNRIEQVFYTMLGKRQIALKLDEVVLKRVVVLGDPQICFSWDDDGVKKSVIARDESWSDGVFSIPMDVYASSVTHSSGGQPTITDRRQIMDTLRFSQDEGRLEDALWEAYKEVSLWSRGYVEHR